MGGAVVIAIFCPVNGENILKKLNFLEIYVEILCINHKLVTFSLVESLFPIVSPLLWKALGESC